MANIDKLNEIFCDVFNVDSFVLGSSFDKNCVDGWDSVRQLSLTASMEDTFGIMLDPEDIIDCNSYEAAKSILAKYEIEL
ncbi:acyl carrier protein [Parabacteroides distasonis]|uniref:acyl carrier protein n=1 Tax=Parabacteroides distasonis TaxID=823 RepID=UPI001476567B|nr:acyl carrier protein [Parabacteroides distasonis]NME14790.1 acyl carrier protein [Parabacteroides distasonis]